MSDVRLNDGSWRFPTDRLEKMEPSSFISSESTLILATPEPYYSQAAITAARAIGVTQDFSLQQQKPQNSQVFEIGSRRKYQIVSGRTITSVSLSSVVFNRGNLLYQLYRGDITGESEVYTQKEADSPMDQAGYGQFYSNLSASLFTRPIGLIVVMQDLEGKNVGAMFLQEAILIANGFNVSANQAILTEQAQISCEGVYPLQHAAGIEAAGDRRLAA